MDILLSQAIDGFLLDKEVSGAGPCTIRNYRLDIARFVDYLAPKDPVIRKVAPNDIRGFIKYLQTTRFALDGVAPRPVQRLSPKTIRSRFTLTKTARENRSSAVSLPRLSIRSRCAHDPS